VIEDVEELGSELQFQALCQIKLPTQGQIELVGGNPRNSFRQVFLESVVGLNAAALKAFPRYCGPYR